MDDESLISSRYLLIGPGMTPLTRYILCGLERKKVSYVALNLNMQNAPMLKIASS